MFETVGGRDAVVSLQGGIYGASQTRGRLARPAEIKSSDLNMFTDGIDHF